MAKTIASQWRAFWHTMTSNDRHAGPDSPYRSGQHFPVPQSKHASLSSTATSAFESRTDLDTDLEAGHGGFVSSHTGGGTSSPPTRRSLQRQGSGIDAVGNGEIQMQSFNDGLPPPPPVAHSWKRMDRWLEDNYEELFEELSTPATINDINELEHELDCTLPQDIRESLQIHDGQERGGMPTGVVFGCMLLDCEEILQEWHNWRTVNEAYLNAGPSYEIPQAPLKAFAGSSSSTTVPVAQPQPNAASNWRQELQDKQDSQPPNAIQRVYAHPAWIPVARDWGGNNIAIDLAPGPAGKWGQVILMGRDYDCKYVISRSWAAFLATLADDMNSDKWWIEEETKELKFRQFKQQGVEPAYIDILRWRSDQKYGRRPPKKRPLRVNSNGAPGGPANAQNGFSPYGSPTQEDRGRSPQRFSGGKAPATSSPRGHLGSPLARVTEETSPVSAQNPPHINAQLDAALASSTPAGSAPSSSNQEKLISGIDTPRMNSDESVGSSSAGFTSNPTTTITSSAFPKSRLNNNVLASIDDEDDEGSLAENTPLSPGKVHAGGTASASLVEGLKEVQI